MVCLHSGCVLSPTSAQLFHGAGAPPSAAPGPFLSPSLCRLGMLLRVLQSSLSPRSNQSLWPPRVQRRRRSDPQVSVAAAVLCAAPLQSQTQPAPSSVTAGPSKLLSDGESAGALASGLATAGMSAQPQTPQQVSHAGLWLHLQSP